MKVKILSIFLFIISISVSSQEKSKIDSINNVLKTKINDTIRIKTLLNLAILLQDSNINTSSKIANKAFELIKKKCR